MARRVLQKTALETHGNVTWITKRSEPKWLGLNALSAVMKNAANRFAAFHTRPAFRLPTRLAVGFGLEALEAFGLIHPGRWQAVALVPPFLGAED